MIFSEFIKNDSWISSIIKKNAYSLNINEEFIERCNDVNSQESKWLSKIKSNPSFVFTKVNPIEIKHIEFLELHNFNLIDTNVTLKKKIEKTQTKFYHHIGFAKEKDKAGTVRVAQNNFVYTRFHLDYRFSKELADIIKGKWVENYFYGKRGDKMVISKHGNEITGFLQIIEKEDLFIIDLIATDKNYRKQGIANEMILFAEDYYRNKGKKEVLVGTQLANIPSIKLYQKEGFLIEDAKYVFHYHN